MVESRINEKYNDAIVPINTNILNKNKIIIKNSNNRACGENV